MAITVTASVLNQPAGVDNSQRRTIVQGTFTLAGSYVTGGFAFPWNGLTTVSGEAVLIPTIEAEPAWVEVQQSIPNTGTALASIILWNYSTNKFQIFVSGTATDGLDELASAATPTTATFAFRAEFLYQD